MEKFSFLVRRLLSVAFLLFILVFSSFSQGGFLVNGKLTNTNGLPVEGVTVQEKGTQNITVSKKDDTFSLRTQSGTAKLILSSVGYQPQELALKSQANVVVTKQATTNSLNEVVVVDYGTQRKSDVTGSLTDDIATMEILRLFRQGPFTAPVVPFCDHSIQKTACFYDRTGQDDKDKYCR